MEQTLREREARLRLLTDNIADIVFIMDRDGILQYVSPSVKIVLGSPETAFLNRPCLDIVHEDDRAKVIAANKKLQHAADDSSVRFRTWRDDGTIVWLESHFKIAQQSTGRELEIVGVLRDVTEQKSLEDELSSANWRLAQLATTDGLTGLANRRSFDAFLKEAYAGHAVLSVLLIDIDYFKGFNDSLGHQAGDACLRCVAEIIGTAAANANGFSARYGGEEFAVILPGIEEERAVKVADAIRLLVSNLQIDHPRAPRKLVTISVGVAEKSHGSLNETALTHGADIALYHAKQQGRNRTVARSSFGFQAPNLAASLAEMDDQSTDGGLERKPHEIMAAGKFQVKAI